jgi:hypothetical protein
VSAYIQQQYKPSSYCSKKVGLFVVDSKRGDTTDMTTGTLAAALQASIGSVAAGSVFATLTSAAMAGYGVPIVLGGVWGVSSAILWAIAAWKKYKAGGVGAAGKREDGNGATSAGGGGDGGGGDGDEEGSCRLQLARKD